MVRGPQQNRSQINLGCCKGLSRVYIYMNAFNIHLSIANNRLQSPDQHNRKKPITILTTNHVQKAHAHSISQGGENHTNSIQENTLPNTKQISTSRNSVEQCYIANQICRQGIKMTPCLYEKWQTSTVETDRCMHLERVR